MGRELPIEEIEASINGEVVDIEHDGCTITIEYEERTYLRAESKGCAYGCEIPIDADYEITEDIDVSTSEEPYRINFYTDDDVSDLDEWGDCSLDYDGAAYVSNFEIIN